MSLPYQLPQHPPQTHAAHVSVPSYAPPAYRPASPASSVGTAYPPDQTSLSDTESFIAQNAFEHKQEMLIGLGRQRDDEKNNEKEVLILVPETPLSMGIFPDGEYPPGHKMIRATERKLEPMEEKCEFSDTS